MPDHSKWFIYTRFLSGSSDGHTSVIRMEPDQSWPGRKEREATTLKYEMQRNIGTVKSSKPVVLRTYRLR